MRYQENHGRGSERRRRPASPAGQKNPGGFQAFDLREHADHRDIDSYERNYREPEEDWDIPDPVYEDDLDDLSDYREPWEDAGDYGEDFDDHEDEIARMRNRKKQGSRRRQNAAEAEVPRGGSRARGTRRKKRKRKSLSRLLGAILILVVLFTGSLFVQRWWKTRDGYWNIAVFGVDNREGGLERGALSDVEIICSINKKTNEIRLVSVYRDTYLQIDSEGTYDKINEAYFLGGHEQAVEALVRNLGIQIDDYATFNWKAVADAINLLGGIDLEITDAEFAYINSFITETVNSTGVGSFHLEHAGMNHLDGVQAVAYCRLRLMDTDFNRTERQRKVIMLALEKAKQADLSVLTTIITGVLPQLSTSIGAEDLLPLARSVSKFDIGATAGFPFAKTTTRIDGLDCVIPMTLESNVAALQYFLYGTEDYVVPDSIKNISAHVSQISGIYEEGEIPGFVYQGSHPEADVTAPVEDLSGQAAASEATRAPETAAESAEPSTEAETEESTEETWEEESSEGSEEETSESEPSLEESSPQESEPETRPVTPMLPDSSGEGTDPSSETHNSPGLEPPKPTDGPGANLPAPDTSGETVGIIHSGNSTGPQAEPGNSNGIPLYSGPGN